MQLEELYLQGAFNNDKIINNYILIFCKEV